MLKTSLFGASTLALALAVSPVKAAPPQSGPFIPVPVPPALGGTGGSDAPSARANLGAAASGTNSDITSLNGLTSGPEANAARAALGVRFKAAASYTLYAGNGTGTADDSNDCLTLATACATVQGAVNKAYNLYDGQGYSVTVSIYGGAGGGDGTGRYDEAVTLNGPLPGGGQVILLGNSNPKLYSSTDDTLTASFGARVKVQNLTLQSTGTRKCANAQFGSVLTVTGITINGCGNQTFDAQNTATIVFQGNAVTFASGITVGSMFHANAQGQMNMDSATFTCAGPMTLVNYDMGVGSGYVEAIGTTFSGCDAVTGIKYSINRNGIIRTNTNNMDFFPGSVRGTNISGGTFDMFQAQSAISRTISTGTSDTATPGDNAIIWASPTSGAKTQALPICSLTNGPMVIMVKDGNGTAATDPISIYAPLSTIDKTTFYTIAKNFGAVYFVCDAVSNWNSVAATNRISLGAAARLYVNNSTGSDANSCLAPSTACATIQRVVDKFYQEYDTNGNNVYVDVTGGGSPYAEAVTMSGPLVGGGLLTIDGNTSPVVSPASGVTFSSIYGARVALRGLALQSAGSSACVTSQFNGASISVLTGVTVNGCGGDAFYAQNQGAVFVSSDFTIASGATLASVFHVSTQGQIIADSRTITCGGAVTMAGAFANAGAGYIEAIGDTFSGCGSVTGARFSLTRGGVVRTDTNNLTYFPGNAVGVMAPGGAYDAFINAGSVARTISSGTSDTASLGDRVIYWNSANASPKSQAIPACNSSNGPVDILIKDVAGTAGTYNITITPATGTIEGASTYVISTNKGRVRLGCNNVSDYAVIGQ